PANAEKLDKLLRGEIVYDADKGFQPGTSPDAKINIRAREAANEPDPDKYFARKDKDTLMRSEDPRDTYSQAREASDAQNTAKAKPALIKEYKDLSRYTASGKPFRILMATHESHRNLAGAHHMLENPMTPKEIEQMGPHGLYDHSITDA